MAIVTTILTSPLLWVSYLRLYPDGRETGEEMDLVSESAPPPSCAVPVHVAISCSRRDSRELQIVHVDDRAGNAKNQASEHAS